jgi:hypothetical protein
MQSQSEITDTNQMWNEQEIKELILYAKSLQQENEDLQAKMIAMNAYVQNADAKIRKYETMLKQLIGKL